MIPTRTFPSLRAALAAQVSACRRSFYSGDARVVPGMNSETREKRAMYRRTHGLFLRGHSASCKSRPFICTRKDVIDKPFPALACSHPRNSSVR